MRVIEPSFEIVDVLSGEELLLRLERYGRTCYKSEDRITSGSAEKMVRMLIQKGHESVLEHEKITVRIICDRGVSHEIVRHRIASYSQESTRYCNYGKAGEVTFIRPFFWESGYCQQVWAEAMANAEESYLDLLRHGASPQEARSVLPNSLKTEIVVTYNVREWRHFFRMRCSLAAHPQMRQLAVPLLEEFKKRYRILFEDLEGGTF